MAELFATRSSRGHRTLCLPIAEESYRRIVGAPGEFRRTIDDCFRRMPELFPADFAHGYQLKDDRMSAKQGLLIRRIVTRDGTAYSIRPSSLMPYLTARVEDVEGPLSLRKFGVPFWALAHVFGGDPMSWYRRGCTLGRFRIVVTTAVRNFTPWHPATTRKKGGWRCPAERLNRHRDHDCWLRDLLISASLGGYRCPLPQNP